MSRSHKEVNGSSNSGEGDEVFEDAVGENEQVANEQVASEQVTCEICQNQFKNFRGLKTHISRMHKEVVSETFCDALAFLHNDSKGSTQKRTINN